MRDDAKKSTTLTALLGAAAALVGTHAQAADDTAAGDRASYRYSLYDEDALTPRPAEGSDDRYRVYTQQFRVSTHLDDRNALSVSATNEVMSGSSPWYVQPDDAGRPVQVMSGATIHDKRREVTATFTRDPEASSHWSATASYSHEKDYRAAALGVERAQALSNALTLGYGASYSHDEIDPVDAAIYQRPDHETKHTTSAYASLAWVLDKTSVLQAGLQLNLHEGYNSDPYKRVFIATRTFAERRPDERGQAAALVRYRHAFGADAALHLDYRYAWDTWGLNSHTVEVAWYQSVGQGWRLVPGLRWYVQHQARFYAPYFATRDVGFASSDYRLSSYGALSAKFEARKRWSRWELALGAERYRSSKALGFAGGNAAPGLVDFTRVYAGLDYLFE